MGARMSILENYLAVEKEMDGKPFTVCDVGTWWQVSLGIMRKEHPDLVAKEAARLYGMFGSGEDKSERGITLEELKKLPSNGTIQIIPKTQDDFIPVDEWEESNGAKQNSVG
jgi:hypothetical protein